jgi:hypothetical protein
VLPPFVQLHSAKSYIYEICVFLEALAGFITSGSYINYHSCHSHPKLIITPVTPTRQLIITPVTPTPQLIITPVTPTPQLIITPTPQLIITPVTPTPQFLVLLQIYIEGILKYGLKACVVMA